jgi:hypothetical protein
MEDWYLDDADIHHARQLLKDHPDTLPGLDTVERHQGNLCTSIDELMSDKDAAIVASVKREHKTVWQVLTEQLYLSICGEDDSLRQMLKQTKESDNSTILAAAIAYVVNSLALPINPAISTLLVLYVLKIGVNTFCEYTGQFRTP